MNGKKISAVDGSLAFKLYQLEIILDHFKGWTIPKYLAHLHNYIKVLVFHK